MKNDYVTIPKLTVDQMAEVHELRVKGVSRDNLGAIYNCGPTTVKRYYNMSKVTGFYMWNEHSPAAEKAMSMIKELSEENESLKIRMKQQADTFREVYDELVSQNNDIMKRINETDKLIDNLRGRDEEND